MRKVVSTIIVMTFVINALTLVGCGKKDKETNQSLSTTKDVINSTVVNGEDIANSKLSILKTLETIVSSNDFIKKTSQEQQDEIQNILNEYVASSVIKAGTISFDSSTRTFNFIYADGENGFYSLSGIKYSTNNEDNLVWQGQTPIVSEPNVDNDSSNSMDTSQGVSGNESDSSDNSISGNNSNSENNYIIGVKLNYNNATGLIQGRFITSKGGAYAFDFTDRFTMMDLDLIEQLTNIIETRTCTYGIDSDTLNNLIQLSNSIDCNADLYQTVGDTQQDIISEIIYTYNRKTGLLVECCASGVKESNLDDPDADSFAIALLDAIDNKVQRLNN